MTYQLVQSFSSSYGRLQRQRFATIWPSHLS